MRLFEHWDMRVGLGGAVYRWGLLLQTAGLSEPAPLSRNNRTRNMVPNVIVRPVSIPRSGKLKRAFTIVLALLGAAGCTPVTAFDMLVPKDSGVELVARDAAYGPEPRQRLDVYRPRRAGPKLLPIIVFFYGGSWSSGTKTGYAFVARALASHGFIVAIPDYRLVPQIRYPAFVEDSAEAVRWIARNGTRLGGDPDRLVMAGHSAGAYNAAMLAYDGRWLGPEQHRIRGFIGLAGPYDFFRSPGPWLALRSQGTADLSETRPTHFFCAEGRCAGVPCER